MMRESKMRIRLLLLLLFFFSFLSVLWVMSQANSLIFSDLTNLSNARFSSYQSLFRFLPAKSYNDRPIGLMFVKALNSIFGLNYTMFHFVFVIIHLINVALVYKIGMHIFNWEGNTAQPYCAILAAAVFGVYPVSLMAVSWISAIYDLLCCLFTLLSILFYLKARAGGQYRAFYAVLFLIFYYLSLRSKEMSLILPLILLLYEVCMFLDSKNHIMITWYLWVSVFFMLFYVILLFTEGRDKISPESPYYQNFSFKNLFRNAIRYLFLYFDWGNAGFSFNKYSLSSLPGILLFLVIGIYSIYLLIRCKDFSLLISILTIGVSLAVVLPMVNMQHRLYLYLPSVFVGFAGGFLLQKAFERIKHNFCWEFVLLLIPCLYLIAYTPGMIGYRDVWLATCEKDQSAIEQIKKIDAPVQKSTIYVKGATEGYNIFYYGPGNSLRLFYDDSTLKTTLVNDFPKNPPKPYVFLECQNGKIKEIKRDGSPFQLNILSIYPSSIDKRKVTLNPDRSLNIGITLNEINPNLVVYLNGQPMQTTIGKDFISAVVPKKDLEKVSITIWVEDMAKEVKTKAVMIPII